MKTGQVPPDDRSRCHDGDTEPAHHKHGPAGRHAERRREQTQEYRQESDDEAPRRQREPMAIELVGQARTLLREMLFDLAQYPLLILRQFHRHRPQPVCRLAKRIRATDRPLSRKIEPVFGYGEAMGKPAAQVRTGDERRDPDGVLHRVVRRTVGSDRRVSIAYNVYKPSGGITLRFVVLAADDETTFNTPPAEPHPDEFDPA